MSEIEFVDEAYNFPFTLSENSTPPSECPECPEQDILTNLQFLLEAYNFPFTLSENSTPTSKIGEDPTIGEIISSLCEVQADGFLTTKPSGTSEHTIHNIYHEGTIEVYFADESNDLHFETREGKGLLGAHFFHVNITKYLKIKNVSGGSIKIGYDGMRTK